jgi:antitoxin (DNA-binding transcriptional repressor) of toxin-antitoxin stability system
MQIVNVFKAKSSLSKLLETIEEGREQEIVIARNGRPVARLTRVAKGPAVGRRIGIAKGRFRVPNNIDASNAEIARLFKGERA